LQPGADALIRMQLTLEECVTGASRQLTVDTAVLCSMCEGSGREPGTQPARCDTCGGAGEVQNVQRSFLGQVVTSRPCPVCRGVGEVIPDPCRQCGGDGRVRARRKVTVKVPAGVGDGMRVRLAGQGEVGPGGGAAGDLYVEVDELEHETFSREGSDLRCTVRVPMTAAALGTTLPLVTLEGTEEIRVEPGTQCATVLTLRGQGMPRLRTSGRVDGRGDLFVHLDVVTPTRLDTRQTELLRELAALRGEEQAELTANGRAGGLFSRLRDSFGGR
jgi:molecular chaperone DnaJ